MDAVGFAVVFDVVAAIPLCGVGAFDFDFAFAFVAAGSGSLNRAAVAAGFVFGVVVEFENLCGSWL
jgi:hypothetical protein